MNHEHELELRHRRLSYVIHLGWTPTESQVTVEAESQDLTEAWRELPDELASHADQPVQPGLEESA